MTRKRDPKKTLEANRPSHDAYDVGYGKPPLETRFKPGQSGNPGGRPKGARNKRPRLNEQRMKEIVLEEAYRSIKVRDGDRLVSVPVARAVIRTLALNAAKGQHRSQKLFAELLSTTETANKQLQDEYLKTAIEYKADWERELERRRLTGATGPEPLPHPDDIEIDMATGEVRIKGPMTKEEKAQYDWLRERRSALRTDLDAFREELNEAANDEVRQDLHREIARIEEVLTTIARVLDD